MEGGCKLMLKKRRTEDRNIKQHRQTHIMYVGGRELGMCRM